MAVKLSRQEYCDMYGPTVGDRIHLADTGLIAEIEKTMQQIHMVKRYFLAVVKLIEMVWEICREKLLKKEYSMCALRMP